MLEIASHADIELDAKIQYIMDGILDDETNKSVLYGATTNQKRKINRISNPNRPIRRR